MSPHQVRARLQFHRHRSQPIQAGSFSILSRLCYNGDVGAVAHLVERSIRIAEVVGSSPICSTIFVAVAIWR